MDTIASRIKEIGGICFAYDGCHKMYVLETEDDIWEAKKDEWDIFEMSKLLEKYEDSCSLRFISNWKLNTYFIEQFEFDVDEEEEEDNA